MKGVYCLTNFLNFTVKKLDITDFTALNIYTFLHFKHRFLALFISTKTFSTHGFKNLKLCK